MVDGEVHVLDFASHPILTPHNPLLLNSKQDTDSSDTDTNQAAIPAVIPTRIELLPCFDYVGSFRQILNIKRIIKSQNITPVTTQERMDAIRPTASLCHAGNT